MRKEVGRCLNCGTEIYRERGRHIKKLCSTKCAGEWRAKQHGIQWVERECLCCGKKFLADYSQVKLGYYKFCSNECRFKYMRGEHATNYKGGYVRSDGYVQISVDGKQMLEHRHLMEAKLGIKLSTAEHVHHKDLNKSRNLEDNLELLPASQHLSMHSKGRRLSQDTIAKMKDFAKNRKRDERGCFI